MTPRASLARADALAELRAILKLIGRGDLMGPGYAYRSSFDFVDREGRAYPPAPPPPGVRRGPLGMCFGNAIQAAVLHGLPYVEGFAVPAPGHIPVHHAWNAGPGGTAIDLTWRAWHDSGEEAAIPGAYVGVEFSVERADDATWNGDASVLDDYRRGWPVFRRPWAGEPDGAEWPPSPRLRALEAHRDGDLAGARRIADEFLHDDRGETR